MRLKEWEVTIQKIIDECNDEQKRADRVLMEWLRCPFHRQHDSQHRNGPLLRDPGGEQL